MSYIPFSMRDILFSILSLRFSMSHIDLADKRLRFVDVPLPLSEVSLRQRRLQRRIKKVPPRKGAA
jgi:hypothetical protein